MYVVDARFDFGWTGTTDVVETLRAEFNHFVWQERGFQEEAELVKITGPDRDYHEKPIPRLTQVDGTRLPNGQWLWDGIFTMTAEIQAHSVEEALDILELAVMEFALRQCGDCWAMMIR